MHPILFKIGGLTFYTHGVLAVLGIILCAWIVNGLARREKLDREFLFDNIVWAVLVGIIGARITYFLLYRDQFSSLKEILYLQNGGLVSYGGFIPGAIIFAILLKYQKQPVAKWFDIMSIGFAAALVIGRIGNLMAGEYAGKLSFSKYTINNVIPINLYEGILVAIIGLILYLVYLKKKTRFAGLLAWLFVFLYGIGRAVIDIWRDENIVFWHLNLSQVTSIVLALLALVMMIYLWRTGEGDQNVAT